MIIKKKLKISLIDFTIRILDLIFSSSAIILLLPILSIISLILLFTGEHKILYKQIRIGKNEKQYKLFKFATMLENSPNIGTREITLENDYRILPFGKILRKTKINELPQLFNILRGDMSIIGPRPLTIHYYQIYKNINCDIFKIKPGLSGIASIVFRNEEEMLSKVKNPENFELQYIIPYKIELEKWFLKNRSILLYFKLIIYTIVVVINPKKKFKFYDYLPEPPVELKNM
jgi:lipopolysaccharide/colanic/teichoic acid biosynthesis glycosyltransferase